MMRFRFKKELQKNYKYLNNSCSLHEVIRWMKQQSFYSKSKKYGKIHWQQFKEEYCIISDEKPDFFLSIYMSHYQQHINQEASVNNYYSFN
jgi:hypothetical protein